MPKKPVKKFIKPYEILKWEESMMVILFSTPKKLSNKVQTKITELQQKFPGVGYLNSSEVGYPIGIRVPPDQNLINEILKFL